MSLEVVVGPMFSGKSSYALSYVRKHRAIGRRVLIIKPDIDNRYSDQDFMVTHDQDKAECMTWKTQKPLCDLQLGVLEMYDCIVLEEAQFFEHLLHFCYELLFNHKKHILVVGLDGCANQRKFGDILDLIPYATSVTKLTAFCSVCKNGTPAPYTRKLEKDWGGEQVDVGGAEKYIAVCLRHL